MTKKVQTPDLFAASVQRLSQPDRKSKIDPMTPEYFERMAGLHFQSMLSLQGIASDL